MSHLAGESDEQLLESLFAELQEIRRAGTPKLGRLSVPTLRLLAHLAGFTEELSVSGAAFRLQSFIVEGIEHLGGERSQPGEICKLILGVGRGSFGSKPSDLRLLAMAQEGYSRSGWIGGPERQALVLLANALLDLADAADGSGSSSDSDAEGRQASAARHPSVKPLFVAETSHGDDGGSLSA